MIAFSSSYEGHFSNMFYCCVAKKMYSKASICDINGDRYSIFRSLCALLTPHWCMCVAAHPFSTFAIMKSKIWMKCYFDYIFSFFFSFSSNASLHCLPTIPAPYPTVSPLPPLQRTALLVPLEPPPHPRHHPPACPGEPPWGAHSTVDRSGTAGLPPMLPLALPHRPMMLAHCLMPGLGPQLTY